MKQINEESIFNAPVTFRFLPKEFEDTFVSSDASPSVKNVRVWSCGGGVVTITDFDDAAESQIIYVLGDGATTVSNNANIKTNTGANKLLAANRIYIFVHINGIWYEH